MHEREEREAKRREGKGAASGSRRKWQTKRDRCSEEVTDDAEKMCSDHLGRASDWGEVST